MHLLSSSGSVKGGSSVGGRPSSRHDTNGGREGDRNTLTGKSMKAKSIAPSVPEHKIKFEEFHNQVSSYFACKVVTKDYC